MYQKLRRNNAKKFNTLETEQLKLLKQKICNLKAGIAAYSRDLLAEHKQAISSRVVRRLVEEIDGGVYKTAIKKDVPKITERMFYWN